jgi:hypothetical protein
MAITAAAGRKLLLQLFLTSSGPSTLAAPRPGKTSPLQQPHESASLRQKRMFTLSGGFWIRVNRVVLPPTNDPGGGDQ